MSVRRVLLAVAAGLVLATLPFLRYVPLGHPGEAHTNHEPRHGGQLGMVGDHHIEVRRRNGQVDVFVSDAWRRPIEPRAGQLIFDGAGTAPLTWRGNRLAGADENDARILEVVVTLSDGTSLATSFDFSEPDGEEAAALR